MTQKAMERKEKEESNSVCVCKATGGRKPDITKSHNQSVRQQYVKTCCDHDSKEVCNPTPLWEVPLVTKKPLACTANSNPSILNITVVYLITYTSHSDI